VIALIREYKEDDINLINVLGRDLHDNYLLKLSSVGKCLVYEDNENVLGFITFDLYSDRAEVIDIIVHINHRHKGIGYALVSKMIEECKNCKNITLEVSCKNKNAIDLYKKSGFNIISTRKRYYENGSIDAYLMYKEI
jgi:ribosomal-protein-alanine N-acetyltransferase